MSRILRTGMSFLRWLIFLMAMLIFAGLTLSGSNPRPLNLIFRENVPIMGTWSVASVYNNSIGYPIVVTFRVFIPVGTQLDLSKIPDVDDRFDLFRFVPCPPNFKDYSDPEWGGKWGGRDNYGSDICSEYSKIGNAEVRNRSVRRWVQGNQQVVEVTYTLQYLLPIDFTHTFTKEIVRSLAVGTSYLRYENNGKVMKRVSILMPLDATFYLVRRVEQGDQPIMDLRAVVKKVSPLPSILRMVAVGLVVGTFAAQGWSAIRRRTLRRRGIGMILAPSSSPTAAMLFASWQKSGEYGYFVEAVRIYRAGFWGKPRPLDWFRWTFIIYSGRILSDSQIKETFEHLISLENGKAVEEVPHEPLS